MTVTGIDEGLVHPFTVTVAVYVPVAAVVAFDIVGFCIPDIKEFTPVHENVPPVTFAAFNANAVPSHIGLLLVIVGALGIE